MNVYDKAHELAKILKESKEYLEFKKMKEEVYNNLETKQKIDEFKKLRYDTQVLSIKGEEQDKEKIVKLQELYTILIADPKVKEYFDIELRFNVLLSDINKIIAEAVKEVIV